ncbi:MAG: serine/threonine-protein kinase [Proteobacteria bacterium]|nr:serine/threonine-protein kinase [Pseudomonadota bacterium]NBP14267.1 serine/threonine-protein kinase [bacterium]
MIPKYKVIINMNHVTTEKIDQLDIIKQIGKGSFSKVYLCRFKDIHLNDSLDLLSRDSQLMRQEFIVKEINLQSLVSKYINNNAEQRQKRNRNVLNIRNHYDPLAPNITPYSQNTGFVVRGDIAAKSKEEEYYYKRLRDLIESEVEVLSVLEHPNIIRFQGCAQNECVYYLNMEYCNGGDVHQLLKQDVICERNVFGGFTRNLVYNFVLQAGRGLQYIHELGLLHRDIKLQNILIKIDNPKDDNGITFKISDFGFACLNVQTKHKLEISNEIETVLTKKYYKLCGTPYYMAPEIILNMSSLENFTQYEYERNKHATPQDFYNSKIDVWSFGICVYELVCNSLPFSHIKNIKDLERFYQTNPQEFFNKRVGSVEKFDKILAHVLSRLLQVDPCQRANLGEVIDYIDKALNANTTKTTSDKDLDLTALVECEDNIYASLGEEGVSKLKQHIVSEPIEKAIIDSVQLSESWERVNKSSSLILKMSVERGFMDWLMNKKK